MEQVMNGKVAAKLWLQVTHVEQFVFENCKFFLVLSKKYMQKINFGPQSVCLSLILSRLCDGGRENAWKYDEKGTNAHQIN